MRRAAYAALLLIGLGVTILVGRTLFAVATFHISGETNDAPTRGRIENLGGLHIPPNARDLRARMQQVMTKNFLFARFTVSAADLPAVMDGGQFPKPTPTPPSMLPSTAVGSDAPDWWTPNRDRALLVTKGPRTTIIIDASDPKEVVVYCFSIC